MKNDHNMGYTPQICQIKIASVIERCCERLVDIERRLDKLESSYSELMIDIERLAEKAGAIEKRLDAGTKVTRGLIDAQNDLQKHIDILNGEAPEVIDDKPPYHHNPARDCTL